MMIGRLVAIRYLAVRILRHSIAQALIYVPDMLYRKILFS